MKPKHLFLTIYAFYLLIMSLIVVVFSELPKQPVVEDMNGYMPNSSYVWGQIREPEITGDYEHITIKAQP